MGFIYMLTNKVDGKRYIGQTQQDDITKRWDKYKYKAKNCIGQYLYNALVKYGVDNFRFQIICICFNDYCNEYEIDYIKKYNTIVPGGYNIQKGGKSTVKRIPWTQEQRLDMSIKLSGVNHPNFGKKASKERTEKMSRTMKEKIKNGTFVPKLDVLKNATDKTRKKVAQYDKHGNLIKIHDSLHDAARHVNGMHVHILMCANGAPYYKTHKGYIWKYP